MITLAEHNKNDGLFQNIINIINYLRSDDINNFVSTNKIHPLKKHGGGNVQPDSSQLSRSPFRQHKLEVRTTYSPTFRSFMKLDIMNYIFIKYIIIFLDGI